MTQSALLPVPFDGDLLYLINQGGEPFAPLKPIAGALGINWATQTAKLNHNRHRWGVAMIATPSPGGPQEMLCLPLRKLPAYLYSIDARKVHQAARPKVERYQAECDDALWDYWSQGHAINPHRLAEEPTPAALAGELSGLRQELARVTQENVALKERLIDLQDDKIKSLEAQMQPKPPRQANRPVKPQEVELIRALRKTGLSHRLISQQTGRSEATISWILRGAEESRP